MKKIQSVLFFLLITGAVAMAQTGDAVQVNPNAPEFQWASETYDFGSIPQGVPVQARFDFTNTGNEPLIITDVQKTCGCTKTEWSKEPVMPGQRGWVMAEFNAASEGAFNKAITVSANAKTPTVKLYFKGTVVKSETGSVPEQESIFGGN
jgi:hypothetical protein